ncbi:MAG: carbon monoxide dehydrogenase subunit G [Bryobacteraceae bacterium]|nr:carbon monoxide dehydrogenase subunit G [Bryobacteraceae bacterium]
MKVAGAHAVTTDQERLYALLQNPEVLARCMPGCDSLVRTGPDTYQMRMKLVMASISGLFDGTVRIEDQNPPDSFRLVVEGRGKIGFLKGDGLLRLIPNGGSTEVAYDGEVHAGGTIANVGQRLMDTTARMIIKRFFDKLSKEAAQ